MPDPVAEIDNAVGLLDDSDYEYELALTHIVAEAGPAFEDEVVRALSQRSGNTDEAYRVFYALNIYYRRRKQYSRLGELLKTEGERFRTRTTYPHLRALYCAETRQQEEAFRCASAAKDRAPQHAGILNHYAEAILDHEEPKEHPDTSMVAKAEEALDYALALTSGSYARHYATQARLHIVRGEYEAAEVAADRAIDIEDRASQDFPIRIGEYEALKLSGRVAKSSRDLERQHRKTVEHLEEVRRSVDAARSDVLQLLGLLAAVIAFVVGTTSIAAQLRDFNTSGRLVVLFTASILVVYAGFGAVYGRLSWKHGLVLALGGAIGAYTLFWWSIK